MKQRTIFIGFFFAVSACCSGCKDIDISHLEYVPIDCPIITDFNPKNAAFGEVVTINIHNLQTDDKTAYEVLIGDAAVPADSLTDVSKKNGTLRFKVPRSAGNGTIRVKYKNDDCAGTVEAFSTGFTYRYTATLVKNHVAVPGTPAGLALDSKGTIWIADQENHLIRKVERGSLTGSIGTAKGCNDFNVGPGNPAKFNQPTDVAADAAGNIYVADQFNSVIRKITTQEGIDLFAGKCTQPFDIPGNRTTNARLLGPTAICVDGNNQYFIDGGKVKKIDASGNVADLTPIGGLLKNASAIHFSRYRPGTTNLYVADNIQKGILSINENSGTPESIVLTPANKLIDPAALEMDRYGNMLIADKGNHQIWIVYSDGTILSLAGAGSTGTTDGVSGKDARFDKPQGLLLVEEGGKTYLYVSDSGNKQIRRITIE